MAECRVVGVVGFYPRVYTRDGPFCSPFVGFFLVFWNEMMHIGMGRFSIALFRLIYTTPHAFSTGALSG